MQKSGSMLEERTFPLLGIKSWKTNNFWCEIMIFEKLLQLLIVKRMLVISKTENIWLVTQDNFIRISQWSKYSCIWNFWIKNILNSKSFHISRFFSFYCLDRYITSDDRYETFSELLRFSQIILMTRMKSVKCTKSHYQHIYEWCDFAFCISMACVDNFFSVTISFLYSASSLRNSSSNIFSKSVFCGRIRRYIKIPSGVKKSTIRIQKTWSTIERVRLLISFATHTTIQNQIINT